jgi:hypothetical protein
VPTPFVLGRDPKKRRREERKKKTSKSDPVLHISTSELNPYSSDHPFP